MPAVQGRRSRSRGIAGRRNQEPAPAKVGSVARSRWRRSDCPGSRRCDLTARRARASAPLEAPRMRRARILVPAVLAATLAALLAAGCSGDGTTSTVDPGHPGNPSCEEGGSPSTAPSRRSRRSSSSARLHAGRLPRQRRLRRPGSVRGGLRRTSTRPRPAARCARPARRQERSFLWLKLAATTSPGSVEIVGAPMPNGLPPITENELEALRLWIYAGAPRRRDGLGNGVAARRVPAGRRGRSPSSRSIRRRPATASSS